MSQIAASGGQPQKQPKYAPIYTGRFFNGLNTNRSPLRAASASHIYEKFYSDTSGDALIEGANIEVSNRLTLVRRPGNPIYDTAHTGGQSSTPGGYNHPDSFGEFRINKSAADVFGTVLESIYTMIDETTTTSPAYRGYLYSLTSALVRGGDPGYFNGLKFRKSTGSGQAYMQEVGNSLYFADGVDNKKWLQSLFERNSAGDRQYLQGSLGTAGTYPFGTYLVDPLSGNIQQFIGITIGTVTKVSVLGNVATFTVTLADEGTEYGPASPASDVPVGANFELLGFTQLDNLWLNGITITLTSAITYNSGPPLYTPTLSATFTATVPHANYTSGLDSAYIIQAGTTPVVALTGLTVPVWGLTQPSAANDFLGSITIDGNTVWVNRGVNYGEVPPFTPPQPNVMNWGIRPPAGIPVASVTGSIDSWQKNTYYSPASVYYSTSAGATGGSTFGYLWQITRAGVTGSTHPAWPDPPTSVSTYAQITNVSITGGVATFTTLPQSLAPTNAVTLSGLIGPALAALNGEVVNVITASSTQFTAAVSVENYGPFPDLGAVVFGGQTITDGDPVTGAQWTAIESPTDLAWAANTYYPAGFYVIAGTPLSLFQVSYTPSVPILVGPVSTAVKVGWASGGDTPFIELFNSADPNIGHGQPIFPGTWPDNTDVGSLEWNGVGVDAKMIWNAVNAGGQITLPAVQTLIGFPLTDVVAAATFGILIPAAGPYVFTITAADSAFFSFQTDSAPAPTISGQSYSNPVAYPQSITVQEGYGLISPGGGTALTGFNSYSSGVASATWTFPQAGIYMCEIDYAHGGTYDQYMTFRSGLNVIPVGSGASGLGSGASGQTQPLWPTFTTSGLTYNSTTGELVWGSADQVADGALYVWSNLGPMTDYVWDAGTMYTTPSSVIIDSNSNLEGVAETGKSGLTPPVWPSVVNTITKDNGFPTLQWIMEGSTPTTTTAGTISATSLPGSNSVAGGYIYWIALVNTLDQTVSNVGTVSLGTGGFLNGQVILGPGTGLGTLADVQAIDPQADYVAVFRSTDGFTTPLLIPGLVNSPYTVPLVQYLENGFVDTFPDAELNTDEEGAQAGENTPPAIGAINLTYHLNRIWYSLGNIVYWTTGPLAPIGNGTDGTAPGNFAACPSNVKRLVPCAIGMLVFTQSDVYIIAGNGTGASPLSPAIPYLQGVGLGNYNAMDINGGLIGFFTTDKQFVIFDPSAGLTYVGFNIGDQFRLNNGIPGQSWVPATAYIAWYVNGEDAGWYIADAVNGWYRMIYTPAPETGSVTWSTFATIQGSCGAIASIETSPGVHNLLIGEIGSSSNILTRNLDATTDNGEIVTIPAYTPETNNLDTAANFDVLAASAVTGSAGAGSTITGGNLGLYPGTSVTNFPPSTVVAPGVQHITDTVAQQAQTDLTAAIIYYQGLTPTLSGLSDLSTGGNGVNNSTYIAGVYVSAPASSLDIPTNTTITLDAQGDAHAIFVFVAGSTITLESGANVVLANGAQAGNVYWIVGSSFTSVWNGIQSNMVGSILAVTSITLGGGNLQGRALANTGAVTMATTETITSPTLAQTPGTTINTGTPYPCYAVIGSIVLANPGQIAKIAFVTTTCVKTGSPVVLGLILNEARPYYKGSFDIIKRWVPDPPNLPPSKSFYQQRFYVAEDHETPAYCMHLQVMLQFPAEAAQNEVQTFCIFGAYEVEV
jgi:hypothetical protein